MPKILLLEDDLQVRAMLRETFVIEGYDVMECADGSRAMEVFRAASPDLVLTDVVMPGAGGIEVITRLKRESPGVPIFALSGGGAHMHGPEVLRAARQAGADRTFAKPLDLTALLEAVHAVTAHHVSQG